MGRAPCCSKVGLHRGPWSATEDALLTNYVQIHGEGNWRSLPINAGLRRCGKSCRLRWMNYLRPGIKRGNISPDEEDLILRLHRLLGNRWSLIAGRLPGRTDNEVKNYWNSHLGKKLVALPGTNHSGELMVARERRSKSKNKNSACRSDPTSVVVHQPKAVRLLGAGDGATRSINSGSIALMMGGDRAAAVEDVLLLSWCDDDNKYGGSTGNSMLGRIYDEYSQLLNFSEGGILQEESL